MCKACPRELNVKRYWYLPHWTKPDNAKRLARYQASAHTFPQNVAEFDCENCNTIHQNISFFKFRVPMKMEGRTATHFGLCASDGTIVFIKV